jgi:glycosyltransferase involved in cell wall biosynthesis
LTEIKNLKIVILQGAFLPIPPALGGAVEKMWYALGQEFIQMRHEVIHISRLYENMPQEEWIGGVLHKRIRGYTTPVSGIYLKWLDLLYTLRAKSIIPLDCDIVVTNTFWAPILLKSHHQKRCFIDVQRMPKGQVRLYHQAARLRANSTPVAEAIRVELPRKQHARVTMIPNPLPFSPTQETNLTDKQAVILYTGRIHPEKGLELLIKSFRNIKSNWQLKIVGPSDLGAGGGGPIYLESLMSLIGPANIIFTGPVYDVEQLNALYREAAIFVYPSIAEQGETFGLAPLEAMAWGCIPVVSGLACFQDFIFHNKNGFIFDHRDKNSINILTSYLILLQKDQNLRLRLAKQALLVRDSHSTAFIAQQFLDEFNKIVMELKVSQD